MLTTERKVTEDGTPITEVQVDAGAGDIEMVELDQPPGVDSLPLPGDSALLQDAPGTGLHAAIGFGDPKNQGKAAEGEHRIYSRTVDGQLVCDVWLKRDGIHVEVHNQSFPITLKSPGRIVLDSPDVRLGNGEASRQVACVGDMVAGSIKALTTAPGSPIAPAAGAPTPTLGVPFVGQIISGSPRAKAT
ncbi:MAG TPA: hypothetical protein VJN18_32800 [Polyangiaceae bacterium]|nr:hypothetical protein [Polyangiaceae bacterium]